MKMKPYCTRRWFVASMMSSIACLRAAKVSAQELESSSERSRGMPKSAQAVEAISGHGFDAFRLDDTVCLHLNAAVLERKTLAIPRLCAPMRSFGWKNQANAELKFVPEPREWVFLWKDAPADVSVIEIIFDAEPVLLRDLPAIRSAADGSVLLHAYQATTHGEKLRFEPQSFKNTVGYWTVPTDYATWNVAIEQPGRFAVAVLQGCGQGQSGSDGVISLRRQDNVKAERPFRTLDTGHFQNFRWRHLGEITLADAGEYELRIEAKKIAKNAFCDVRAVHLVRQAM
jgi:hypothetical protein